MRFAALLGLSAACALHAQGTPSITVTVPASAFPPGAHTLTGHLLVVFSKHSTAEDEPRDQVQEQYDSAQAFGVDVDGLKPGDTVEVNADTAGYPLHHLTEVPAGSYFVQAVFNVYEPFHLGNGKTVMLPPDHGEGQHWNRKPGNPYSAPARIAWPGASAKLVLDKVIPPVPSADELLARDPGARPYLRYIHMRSAKLSAFWGRDMFLDAWVLLPPGFDEHPGARYPTVVYQDHFHPGFELAFRSTPPTPALEGRARAQAEAGYHFLRIGRAGACRTCLLFPSRTPTPTMTIPMWSTQPMSGLTARR